MINKTKSYMIFLSLTKALRYCSGPPTVGTTSPHVVPGQQVTTIALVLDPVPIRTRGTHDVSVFYRRKRFTQSVWIEARLATPAITGTPSTKTAAVSVSTALLFTLETFIYTVQIAFTY